MLLLLGTLPMANWLFYAAIGMVGISPHVPELWISRIMLDLVYLNSSPNRFIKTQLILELGLE